LTRSCIICTPISRAPHTAYVTSLIQSMAEVNARWMNIVGHANTPRARNILAHKALALGFDDVLMIDDDISWDVEDLKRLLSYPAVDPVNGKPCVYAGAPQRRTDDLKFCVNLDKMAERETREYGDEDKVNLWSGGAATAFMRIPREVFDVLREEIPMQPYVYQEEKDIYPYFDYEIRTIDKGPQAGEYQYMGEDYLFCHRVREAGMQVYIDPKCQLSHWHNTPLNANLQEFIDRLGEERIVGEGKKEDDPESSGPEEATE